MSRFALISTNRNVSSYLEIIYRYFQKIRWAFVGILVFTREKNCEMHCDHQPFKTNNEPRLNLNKTTITLLLIDHGIWFFSQMPLSHRFLLVFIPASEFVRVLILCEIAAKYCNTFVASSAHSFSSDYHVMLFWFFLQLITAYSYRLLTECLIFSFPLFFGQTQRIFFISFKILIIAAAFLYKLNDNVFDWYKKIFEQPLKIICYRYHKLYAYYFFFFV